MNATDTDLLAAIAASPAFVKWEPTKADRLAALEADRDEAKDAAAAALAEPADWDAFDAASARADKIAHRIHRDHFGGPRRRR